MSIPKPSSSTEEFSFKHKKEFSSKKFQKQSSIRVENNAEGISEKNLKKEARKKENVAGQDESKKTLSVSVVSISDVSNKTSKSSVKDPQSASSIS